MRLEGSAVSYVRFRVFTIKLTLLTGVESSWRIHS